MLFIMGSAGDSIIVFEGQRIFFEKIDDLVGIADQREFLRLVQSVRHIIPQPAGPVRQFLTNITNDNSNGSQGEAAAL
ncbi:MAG: hypothetical protein QF393_11125 [Rhodospirillales bacterium]|nr:hypothetical protein [Rhodospirillales bacterium]MDP6644502.1 hypothetical protein [Rhodospirillales bacterium]